MQKLIDLFKKEKSKLEIEYTFEGVDIGFVRVYNNCGPMLLNHHACKSGWPMESVLKDIKCVKSARTGKILYQR